MWRLNVALAIIAAGLAGGGVRLYFEHGSFEGTVGLIYATSGVSLAVSGWLLGAGRGRGDLLLAAAASLALVATRREVWDYYYVEAALLVFFSIRRDEAKAPGSIAAGVGWWRVALAVGAMLHAWFWWELKERVDQDAAAVRIAEQARRERRIDILDVSALPMSFAGWHLHPYFVRHDGQGDPDIGGFMRYLRTGALEVRWSARRFWRDSRTLRPIEGVDAKRVVASEVVRVGWFWWQRCSLLRRSEDVAPARLRLERELFREGRFPLGDGEWRTLIETGDLQSR